jgi:transcriptional regulator with XRE-family HTH domain
VASHGITNWDGSRLRALREMKGMTRPDLARAVGVTKVTVFYWEDQQRRRSPMPANLVELARILGVSTTLLAPLPDPPTLAAYREHAGLTQAEIADALGMARNSVSDIETSGEWWPARADEWASMIGIDVEQFRTAWQHARGPNR